jgi:hypothetical protein
MPRKDLDADKKFRGHFISHSWAIEDGSFLRINNITVGYSLPAKNIAGLKMSQLRFYFTSLLTWQSLPATAVMIPEVSVRNNPLTPGLDYFGVS